MTALSILNIKEFMHILLRTETFDSFLLSEGSITTYMTVLLDGHSGRNVISFTGTGDQCGYGSKRGRDTA